MDWGRVIDVLARGLETASAEIELAQSVSGLDVLRELDLHPHLHSALRAASFGVYAEQRLPSARASKKRSQGVRADIVITTDQRPLVRDADQLDLFDAQDSVSYRDAGWLEVKVVAQHRESGPNRAYESAISRPVFNDVLKLARDPEVRHAAVLLVLFTETAEVASHDLDVWNGRALAQGLPLEPRRTRAIPIGDRLGNRLCTLALFVVAR